MKMKIVKKARTKMPKVNRTIAAKVLTVVDHGLSSGIGDPILGRMCVEAAVCYAFGEDHGDEPKCVAFPVCELKININDATGWSSNAARAKGLRRVAIAQLGTQNLKRFRDGDKFIAAVEAELPQIRAARLKARAALFENFKKLDKAHAQATTELKKLKKSFNKDPLKFSPNEANNFSVATARLDEAATRIEGFDTHEEGRNFVDFETLVGRAKNDKELTAIAEAVTRVLIKWKSPGSKFLYLTKMPKAKLKKLAGPVPLTTLNKDSYVWQGFVKANPKLAGKDTKPSEK